MYYGSMCACKRHIHTSQLKFGINEGNQRSRNVARLINLVFVSSKVSFFVPNDEYHIRNKTKYFCQY